MAKCLVFAVCAVSLIAIVFCAPGYENIREKQSTRQDVTDQFKIDGTSRKRRQSLEKVDIIFIDADRRKLKNLQSKESSRLAPVNDIINNPKKNVQHQPDTNIELVTQNANYLIYKMRSSGDEYPSNFPDDKTAQAASDYPSYNYDQYSGYSDVRRPPPPPPPDDEGPPPPPPDDREPPPPPPPPHHYPPPPPPHHYPPPPPPHHYPPPPPPHHHPPPPPPPDDYRSNYYDRSYSSYYDRYYNRPPPPPPPPPPPYDDRSRRTYDDRQTRQSSYDRSALRQYGPPPPHRGGPPPYYGEPRPRPEGPPPPYGRPPPRHEGPPPRHEGPPPRHEGPPPPYGRPPPRHEGPPPPYGRPPPNHEGPPPPSERSPPHPNGPPDRFDEKPQYDRRPPPPPTDRRPQPDRGQSYERGNENNEFQQYDDNSAKLIDATRNNFNSYTSSTTEAGTDDNPYQLDVRFSDDEVKTTEAINPNTVTTARPLSPFIFQAAAVTPED